MYESRIQPRTGSGQINEQIRRKKEAYIYASRQDAAVTSPG